MSAVESKPAEEIEEEDTEGVDLYKGSFSLAYGTLTLLHDTKMHLKCNRFYGLLGPNQCGKTTLMRAIANEQLEGFPKRDELKSVFVEHEFEDEEVGVAGRRLPDPERGQAGLVVGDAHLQRDLQAGNPGDGGAVQEAHEEHWLRIPGRPGPHGEPGAARDELLRRLENEDAAVRGSADELRCAHAW